jgi:hypothetical protein
VRGHAQRAYGSPAGPTQRAPEKNHGSAVQHDVARKKQDPGRYPHRAGRRGACMGMSSPIIRDAAGRLWPDASGARCRELRGRGGS